MDVHTLKIPTTTSGHATAEGTKTFADITWQNAPKTSPDSWRILDGKTVSKSCFGTLGFHKNKHPESTLTTAFKHGCNLIDCSLSFSNGEDLKALGKALKTALEEGHIERDQCVILSKVQACELSAFQNQYQTHLQAMGIKQTDYVLVQEPEMLSLQGLSSDEIQSRVLSLFEWLETLTIKGEIQGYGLSSQTFGAPSNMPTHTCLATYAELAREAAQKAWGRKKRSAFKVISAPFNLIETELLTEKSTWEFSKTGDKQTCSTLDLASRMSLSVITQRPLNALHPHFGSVRLIEYNAKQHNEQAEIAPYISHIQGLAHYGQIKNLLESQISAEECSKIENALMAANNTKTKPLRAHLNTLVSSLPFHQACISALSSTPGITSVAHSFTQSTYTKDIANLMESADIHYIHKIFAPTKETEQQKKHPVDKS
jgi:hypothetical protein